MSTGENKVRYSSSRCKLCEPYNFIFWHFYKVWAGVRWHGWVPVTRVWWCIVLWNHSGGWQCASWSPGDSLVLGCTYQWTGWGHGRGSSSGFQVPWLYMNKKGSILNIFPFTVRTGMNHISAFVKHKRLSSGQTGCECHSHNAGEPARPIYPHREVKFPSVVCHVVQTGQENANWIIKRPRFRNDLSCLLL